MTHNVAGVFETEQRFLWGLSYRMTGCAADADDIVQETFARALEHPPADTTMPWRPWLTRVALNLSRDLLRRRKRRAYVGPWLPSPIETGDEASPAFEPVLADGQSTEGRYDLVESVSMAFLLALEALTPQQRGVLLLRDVFDYSVRETAAALGISEATVKTSHHRARRAMADYARERCRPTRGYQDRVREALTKLVEGLVSHDQAMIEAALSPAVVAMNDGGGEYFAARKPLRGAERVAKFYRNITERGAHAATSEIRMINGLPAVLTIFHHERHREPPRSVTYLELDRDGKIRRLYSIVASRKLTAINF